MNPLESVLSLIGKGLDKLFPDAGQAAQLKAQLATLAQQGQLDALAAEVKDRDSARQREMAVRDSTPRYLAWLIVLGYAAVQAFLLTSNIAPEMREIIMRTLGTLDASLGMVLAYYFGSSAGSRSKDETIKELTK